jgi:hypothetical protein
MIISIDVKNISEILANKELITNFFSDNSKRIFPFGIATDDDSYTKEASEFIDKRIEYWSFLLFTNKI